MFVLRQEKLFELDQAQNQEFLFDLVYEIIKENPSLKLNGQFNELIIPTQKLMNQYLEKGVNQINSLKYMIKSHVYLGVDYEKDPQFEWIKLEMENYSIRDQVSYVDAFFELLEDYKKKVIGVDFVFFIKAINRLMDINKENNIKNEFKEIYPEKSHFLREKIILDQNSKDFVLGVNFKENYFLNNIYKVEV